jgi:predicted nuclease with TOPRIM domain
MPVKTDWKNVLESARRDLDELRANRDELEAELNEVSGQIVQLEQLVASLHPMASEVPQEASIMVEGVADLELADAIREVLKQSDQYRTPRGVRDSLRASDYDLDQHTNALASIHGVLKRLVSSREAEQLESKGKTYYRWKPTGPQSSDWIEALKRSVRPREHGPFDALGADRDRVETRLKKRR